MPVDYTKIRALREMLSLTQTEAAIRAGFKPDQARQLWWQIETGKRATLTVETLERVAKALGVAASDLLTPPKD